MNINDIAVAERHVRDRVTSSLEGLAVGACFLIGLLSRCADRGPSSCQ